VRVALNKKVYEKIGFTLIMSLQR